MAITKGPLNGIRVLDLSQAHAGPFGTMLLGDLGAEIIKLESPVGDLLRVGDPTVNILNYYILSLNRNKKSIVLDLESKKGKKAFYDLVKNSDVVYSNFRADVLEKQGSDFDALKKINPRIIRCNISGYGHTGPYTKYPAYDIIACGHSGILSVSGEEGRPPVIPGGIAMADMMGGIYAVLSVLASIISRSNKKKGVRAEVNLLDSMIFMQKVLFQTMFATGNPPSMQGRRHHMLPTYGLFETKDGFMTIGPSDDSLLIKLTNLDHIKKDPDLDSPLNRIINKDKFMSHFEKALKQETTNHWLKLFRDENDIASGPVLNYEEVVNDPQVIHNDMIKEMDLKGDKYKTIGSIFKMPGVIEGENESAPDLGAHTKEILQSILNYSDSDVEEILKENQVAIPRMQNRKKNKK